MPYIKGLNASPRGNKMDSPNQSKKWHQLRKWQHTQKNMTYHPSHLHQPKVTQTKPALKSWAGRRKGSRHQKKRLDIKNYKECLNATTEAYDSKLT